MVQSLCAKQLTTCQINDNLVEVFTSLKERTSSGIKTEWTTQKFRISFITPSPSNVSVLNSEWNNELWLRENYLINIRDSRKSTALPSVSKLSIYWENKLKLVGGLLAQNYLVLTRQHRISQICVFLFQAISVSDFSIFRLASLLFPSLSQILKRL